MTLGRPLSRMCSVWWGLPASAHGPSAHESVRARIMGLSSSLLRMFRVDVYRSLSFLARGQMITFFGDPSLLMPTLMIVSSNGLHPVILRLTAIGALSVCLAPFDPLTRIYIQAWVVFAIQPIRLSWTCHSGLSNRENIQLSLSIQDPRSK